MTRRPRSLRMSAAKCGTLGRVTRSPNLPFVNCFMHQGFDTASNFEFLSFQDDQLTLPSPKQRWQCSLTDVSGMVARSTKQSPKIIRLGGTRRSSLTAHAITTPMKNSLLPGGWYCDFGSTSHQHQLLKRSQMRCGNGEHRIRRNSSWR